MKSQPNPLLLSAAALMLLSIACGTLDMSLVEARPTSTAESTTAVHPATTKTEPAASDPSPTIRAAPTASPTNDPGPAIHAELKTILDVDGPSVLWSPDGTRLYVGEQKLHIFDSQSLAEIRTIDVSSQVSGMAVSPDGGILAVIDGMYGIVLIDTAGGNVLRTLTRSEITIGTANNSYLAFTPDGATLAAVIGDVVKLYDIATGEETGTIVTKSPFNIAVSPDGKSLYTGGWSDEIRVYDIATGQPVRTFGEKSRTVNRMTLSPDGSLLVSAGPSGGTMILWDAAAGRQLRLLSGHSGGITDMAFSPDNRWLASASDDVTIKLWDTAGGRELQTLTGHSQAPQSLAVSPDGKTLVSGSQDGTTRLWSIVEGAAEPTPTVATAPGSGPDLRPTPVPLSGRAITAGNASRVKQLTPLDCKNAGIAVWSPDGKWLVAGGYKTHFFDAAHLTEIRNDNEHSYGLAISPDSRILAVFGYMKVMLIDLSSGAEQRRVAESNTSYGGTHSGFLAFSPDSAILAVIFQDVVKLYDVATGEEEGTIPAAKPEAIVISPDGRYLYAAEFGGEISVWDIATRTRVRSLGDKSRSVNRLALSPDGSLLASSGYYQPTILWDTATGRELRSFTGHTDSVLALAFSPDGKLLFTGSRDVTIKIWDLSTGTLLTTLTGHTEAIESVAVSPVGATLATGSSRDGVLLWGLPAG